jgi:N-carbamoyl-L-amino-acid hydrolase
MMQVSPNSRNTIPGSVFLTVDLRHPDDETLSTMEAELRVACAEICDPAGIDAHIDMIWYSPPIAFDKDCVGAVKQAAGAAGYENMEIIVPCEDGVSHNESESATPEDLAAGCNVLLYAMLERASA